MQTLVPQSAGANAAATGRFGAALRFGLTARTLWIFAVSFAFTLPAAWHPRALWFGIAWDGLILLLCLIGALSLPSPAQLRVSRNFDNSPQLGQPLHIRTSVEQNTNSVLDVFLTDDLAPALITLPRTERVKVFPREAAEVKQTVTPRERGDVTLGRVYLRYRSSLAMVERWAAADLAQTIRVFPAHDDAKGDTELFLLRARQLEMQKRKLRMRGIGRDFESMREYAAGDEMRNISWTASARRGRLITRQFTVERSQQVWIVVDAGRLSATALHVERSDDELIHETAAERDAADTRTITQLDEAARAAVMLSQVIRSTGDKVALLTYGRTLQQVLPPATGASHLRWMLELLSQTRSDRSEADHLLAVARLKQLQRRRGLIIWITELVDQAGKPELVRAAAELTRQHLVLLVLLVHPELEELAGRMPSTRNEMYSAAAAEEMLMRRRETVAQLERAGVLIVETTPAEAGAEAINKYLEIKARGQL